MIRKSHVKTLFDRYAADASQIPPEIVSATLAELRVRSTPELERNARDHLQQVFWLAARGLEPIE